MKRTALTLLLSLSVTATAAIPEVAAQIPAVSRSSTWAPASSFKLQFKTHHPQGMVKVGNVYYMSSVEITEPTQKFPQPQDGFDRTPGKGKAHLFKFDGNGKLLADIILAEGEGNVYHPGGIDTDGKFIYVPVAEYRPNSASILYKVDIATNKVTEVLRYRDHLGGVVVDPERKQLHMVSWGARRWYTWPLGNGGTPLTNVVRMVPNPQSYVDYQDCHSLEAGLALCSGVAYVSGHPTKASFGIGGIDLVNFNEGRVLSGFPVPLWDTEPASATDATYRAMTTNPFTVWNDKGNLTFAFAPHDEETTVYLYTVK